MVNDKERYIQFCAEERLMPIFSQPWWLDAVCDKRWDVILIEKGGHIAASFPYYIRIMNGYRQLTMPTLTQKLGIYAKYPPLSKLHKRLSLEKEITDELIGRLPNCDSMSVNFNYTFTNWLPFYWKGFTQSTRYTYIVKNLDVDLMEIFAPQKRTDIRKAQKHAICKYGLDGKSFIDLYCQSLKKQGKSLTYSKELFLRLYDAVMTNNAGNIIYAVLKDKPETITGAIFYVKDNISIYSLVTMFDPDYRSLATSSLLFYELMRDHSKSGLSFDFEGSMIENCEKSYNKFGTSQMPYFQIRKDFSKKYIIKHSLRAILNALFKG